MLDIIFEDNEIIVVKKPIGVTSENGMVDLLRKYLGDDAYIGIIHRLDTAVSGVMVYAKKKSAAANLSGQIQQNTFKKQYLAVVSGCPDKKSGRYEDLLFKDSSKNKSFVVKRVRKGVKKAILDYEVMGKKDDFSLIKITLHTGRTHQIRVQFSARKMPLLCDKKYGGHSNGNIALFSHSITFIHPGTKELMNFTLYPDNIYPFNKF